jgi:RND family efflux transporter MFP subunit
MTRIKYLIAIVVLVGLTFWFGWFHKPGQKPQSEKIVPVEVRTVEAGSIEQIVELTGWIKASQMVDVASKVPGRVESLEVTRDDGSIVIVEEGLEVKKGEIIAVIDHDIYLAQLAAAKAAIEAGQVELADAEREKNRMLTLFESGSATAQARDKAVTTAQLAAAALNTARANLELAEVNLKESQIVSPIDGIVTAKHIDRGNMIRAGDRIVTIADVKTVKVVVSISEKYGEGIAAGTPVRLAVDAFGDRQFEASVYSVYPVLDESTHTVQIEIRLENGQMLLKPGMFARCSLIIKRKDNVVVIPKDVILGGKIDKPYVYVVEDANEQKKAHKRIVEIGITQADRCEIAEGLRPGETLVVNGMQYLADEIGVEVVNMKDIK